MSKNKPQKSLNTGKIQVIHGMHAVRAALLNTKRIHHELFYYLIEQLLLNAAHILFEFSQFLGILEVYFLAFLFITDLSIKYNLDIYKFCFFV